MKWELKKQNLEMSFDDERIRKLVEMLPEPGRRLFSREREMTEAQGRYDTEHEFALLYDKLLKALLHMQEPEMFISLFSEVKESIHSSLFMC